MEPYEKFYSGACRKEMHRVFTRLIKAIKDDDFNELDDILTVDCIADFSTYGHLVGLDEIKQNMKWPGPSLEISKARIFNFVARSQGHIGQQIAYVQYIVAKDDGINLYPFLYGGEFSNSFVYIDHQWKINRIRFDLCYECGNNLFVQGHWHLMDYQKYDGHAPMINPELDNPWYVIGNDQEGQSDEEQVFELMSKYAYAFDHGDFNFLKTFTTNNFFINGSSKRKNAEDSLEEGDFLGHRAVSDFLRDKFHKEARMMHACRMQNIVIDGNKAIAFMPRSEEHRLKNRLLNRQNIHSLYSTALHYIYAIKEGADWKMYKYRIEPLSQQIQLNDSDICFDEHVLGEVK